MRLIYADDFERRIMEESEICEDCAFIVVNLLDDAPTVDAVPVVHGKWLHDESGANLCSQCMEYVYEDDVHHLIWHTKYCPHCGAKMDGERKEGEKDDWD